MPLAGKLLHGAAHVILILPGLLLIMSFVKPLILKDAKTEPETELVLV